MKKKTKRKRIENKKKEKELKTKIKQGIVSFSEYFFHLMEEFFFLLFLVFRLTFFPPNTTTIHSARKIYSTQKYAIVKTLSNISRGKMIKPFAPS